MWEAAASEESNGRRGPGAWPARAWLHSRHLLASLILLSAWTWVQACAGASEPAGVTDEYRSKAACLLNFARFVSWPEKSFAGADAPIVIGVLGDNPFGNAIAEAVRGESVRGRKLEVRSFPSIMQPYESAQLLFISRSEKYKLRTIFSQLRDSPVLTVGDTDGFAQSGGMINLVVTNRDIHFEINSGAAERVGLSISSKLLDLPKASKVRIDPKTK